MLIFVPQYTHKQFGQVLQILAAAKLEIQGRGSVVVGEQVGYRLHSSEPDMHFVILDTQSQEKASGGCKILGLPETMNSYLPPCLDSLDSSRKEL